MKKRRKVLKSKTKSSLDTSITKTERSAVAVLMYWMREIIEEEHLDLGLPDVDTSGADRKSPDIVIYETRRSKKVLCLIEAKRPSFDLYNELELKEPARSKASRRKAKYFGVTNFKQLVIYDTGKVNDLKSEEEQIVDKYILSTIEDLDRIEDYRRSISSAIKQFLIFLVKLQTGKETPPRIPIDEHLINRLHEKIRVLAGYYSQIIFERYQKESKFKKDLGTWFKKQNWNFQRSISDFDKAARQTAYLLVNKILFYDLLQLKRPDKLEPLEIPKGLFKGSSLEQQLQKYFNDVLEIDYQTVYTTDFIDTIAFPDSKEVVGEVRDLVTALQRYDLAQLGYDVLGRIFERIIPEEERHNLGQYFTRSDIVDLILRFCVKHEDDKVLDPSCGAGTFLVRAYQHKKMMNETLKHEKILDTLYGNDIAKFPAHLATINLAIKDLGSNENYPKILQEDFFALAVKESGFDSDVLRKKYAIDLAGGKSEVTYPRYFDAKVGNPPYTRQEEISEMASADKKYKEDLIDRALLDVTGKPLAKIGKRAGIHAYFFIHGFKFLKQGGRFGFIVSESWLDVDYGKGLQEFFLKNYKIVAIITSKVERWFAEADINTCIIILEKCAEQKAREDNLCRFVYLKKTLDHFIPPAKETWQSERDRLREIDSLMRTIMSHDAFYENEDMRIYPKSQKELWEEGAVFEEDGGHHESGLEEKQKYIGSKWGKYLRAPEIFFKILEKGKGNLVPLKEVAEVRFGIKTGANEFFYLTEEQIKKEGIEKEFWMHRDEKGRSVPNFVVVSPRECYNVIVNPSQLRYIVLIVNKTKSELKGKNVLKYLAKGERKGFHKRPTCMSRAPWYNLGRQIPPHQIWFKAFNDRVVSPINKFRLYASDRFYAIYFQNAESRLVTSLALNSTLQQLFVELWGRVVLGQGALDNMTYEAAAMLVVVDNKMEPNTILRLERVLLDMSKREIKSVFEEIGAKTAGEVTLNNVLSDRRELDKIVMGDILGLTEDEQLEVYRAVVDLVKSRIEKAKSVGKGTKYVEGIDMDALTGTALKEFQERKKK